MKQVSKIYNQETNRVIDNNGFLYVKTSPILKSGILEYYGEEFGLDKIEGETIDKDKIYKVYIPLEEIKKALNDFKNKPITLEHEWLGSEGQDSKGFQVGNLGEQVFIKDNMVFSNLEITSQEAIEEIENGNKAELSASYEQSFVKAPQGENYDFIAVDIKPNHIALVEKGRCGNEVRVYNSLLTKKENRMDVKLTVDGNEVDLTELVARKGGETPIQENNEVESNVIADAPIEEEPKLDFDDKQDNLQEEPKFNEATDMGEKAEAEPFVEKEEEKVEMDNAEPMDKKELIRQILELSKKLLSMDNQQEPVEENIEETKEEETKVENSCDEDKETVKVSNYDKIFNSIKNKVEQEYKNKIKAFNSVKGLVSTDDYDFFDKKELDIYNDGLKSLGMTAKNVEEAKGMIKAYNSCYKMDENFSYNNESEGKDTIEFTNI